MHFATNLHDFIPALLLLALAETVYLIKEKKHDQKDMLSSFALLAGTLPVSLITTGVIASTYNIIYQFHIFNIPVNSWWCWVILFISDDFSYYWYHRASHQVRFLWASHMVHHSSEKFNLTSGLRVPWTGNLSGVFLFWSWIPLMGIEPSLVIYMKSMSIIYQFGMHTEAIKKLPKWFENVCNTPSHHRVHHASNVEYLDKNFAGTLIIWDKLFGTFKEEASSPEYGLTKNIKSANPFSIAFHGWKDLLIDFKKANKLIHRIRYFINPPGWSHNRITGTTNQLQESLKNQKNSISIIKQNL